MSDEERESIRAQLLSNFNEPVGPIATQLAVLISKVARLDCPRNWPELIPTLLEAVKNPDKLAQQRALLTLHHVTKTLAAKRLANDRKLFQEVLHGLQSNRSDKYCRPKDISFLNFLSYSIKTFTLAKC